MSTQMPGGQGDFPAEALAGSVGERFLAVAGAHAERTALRSPAGEWTYARLDADVRRLAGALVAATADDASVAILVEHDGPLVVALLGAAVAGRPMVVLDPTAPADDLARTLAASRAALVVHDPAHADAAAALVAAAGAGIGLLDLTEVDADPLAAAVARTGNDPFMLAFTSGTTGESKAAIIPNGLLLNVVRGATLALSIGPDDRLPMLFPASLAVAAYPAFIPLLNGGTLATLDLRSVGLAPLADFLVAERISVVYLAPTIVRFLVGAVEGRVFPDLRVLALGGELVDAEIVGITSEAFGPRWVANGFGATETGVIALHLIDPEDVPEGPIPAGRPVPDIELAIVDDTGSPVEPGTAGEILVRSPYLFGGYLGHDELSAQVLGPDPEGRPGWMSYRTGDLGRLDPDGSLVVLGRLDATVKVRGRLVVIGDVEREVCELDDVAAAVVVAVVEDGVTELGAMVVPEPGTTPTPADLRRRLLEARQPYRVPTRWRVVEALPLLPNGKVDRRGAVAELSTTAVDPAGHGSGSGPATGSERAATVARELRDLWELLLPVEVVGPDDDFMALGGHSLLAAQMLVMAETRLGITIPMSELLHARTLRQLIDVALRIDATAGATPSTVACVQEGDPSRPRLWFLHDLPGSAYRVRHLASALGADQPVWSFESPLLRGEPNPFRSLDTFVARYLRDLRREQPEGPYWLAGYSFGGPCAYEMALQLLADGEEVAFLGIVDTGPSYRGPNWTGRHSPPWPYFGVPQPPPPEASVRSVAQYYRAMYRSSPRSFARHLSLRTGLARRVDAVRFALDLRRRGRVRPEWRLWYAWEQHWRLATRAWDRTKPYPGRLDLFWASLTGSTDGTMGWGPLVDDLRIWRYEGFHDHLLEESGSPALAAAMRPVLDAVIESKAAESKAAPTD